MSSKSEVTNFRFWLKTEVDVWRMSVVLMLRCDGELSSAAGLSVQNTDSIVMQSPASQPVIQVSH